jgi:hypothetical protein
MFTSSEHAWDPMASSSVNFSRKTRTVPDRATIAEPQAALPDVATRGAFSEEEDVYVIVLI